MEEMDLPNYPRTSQLSFIIEVNFHSNIYRTDGEKQELELEKH